MKIVFDSEEQREEFMGEHCPDLIVNSIEGPHLFDNCKQDCYVCWKTFPSIILEVKDCSQ